MIKQFRHLFKADLLLFALLICTLAYSTAVADAWYTPRLIVLVTVLLIAQLFLMKHHHVYQFVITLPVVAYAAIVVLAFCSLLWAPNVGAASYVAIRWLVGFLVFFTTLLVLSAKENSSQHLAGRLSWVAILVVLFSGVLGAIELNPEWGNWAGLSGNRNQYSSYLFLLLPFVLGGWSRSNLLQNAAIGLAAVAIVGTIVMNSTRAVWLALTVGLVAYLMLQRGWYRQLRYAAVLTTLLLTFVVLFSGQALLWLTTQVNVPVVRSLAIRLELWSKSLPMVGEHFWLGRGLGGWQHHFPAYWKGGIEQIDLLQQLFQSVHNDWLQLLVELGVSGFLAYSLFFALSWWRTCKKAEEDKQPPQHLTKLMLSAVPAYALIAFFSFPGQRIEHLVLLNLMIAMLSVQRNTTRLVYPLKRPFLLIMLVLSAGAMTFAFNRYAAEKQLQKMRLYRLKQHANPAAVVWHSTQAWHNWHTIDEHGIPIKWYTGNALVALNNLEQAHFYFEQAFKEQPYHLQNLADLAAAEVNVGNYSRAKELYLRALAIFPDYGEARKNLAVTYLNTGVSDSAMKHMQLVPLPDKINFVQSLLVAKPLPPYTQPIKNLLREAVLDTASMQVYRNKFAQQYLKQKNYDEAWDWYATSTALRYVDVQGMVKIAKHYAEKQDKSYYNEVLSHLREVQLSRGDAAIILAQFFMEQHDKESAVVRLKTADCPLTPSSEQLRTAIWKELTLPIAEKPTCE